MTEQRDRQFERPPYTFHVESRGDFYVRYRLVDDTLVVRLTLPGGYFIERPVRMSETPREVYRNYSAGAIGFGQFLSDPQVERGFCSTYEAFLAEYKASQEQRQSPETKPSE